MKTITINLYPYEELSKEAQERAHADFTKDHYDPFLQSHMINLVGEKLEENGIKHEYPMHDIDVRYSLSHCQGDGFMFTGSFTYKGERVDIEHRDPHYYHKYTAQITWPDFVGEEKEEEEEKLASEFLEVYRKVCDEMEEAGYAEIEYQMSEEYFRELCDANEWTFEENGEMRNA